MKLNKKFFDSIRASLFAGSLSQPQVDSLNAIFEAWVETDSKDTDLLAYSLATAYHEVGRSLQPIQENLNYTAKRITEVWPTRFKTIAAAQPFANNPQKLANNVYGGRLGNTGANDGWLYRGRGFPQITGKVNYKKFADLLNIDLVKNPDLAMQPKTAAKILILGIRNGLFTGKKLSDYNSFVNARPTVNADGSRKTKNGNSTIAKDIAGYANSFKTALNGGIDKGATGKPQEPSTGTGNTENPISNLIRNIVDALVKILQAFTRR